MQIASQLCVDGVDLRPANAAARDIGLVGDNDQQETLAFQRVERLSGVRDDGEFAEVAGRVGLAGANDRFVEHAVAIEEDRSLGGPGHHRVPSNFVRRISMGGWVTSRCQITARETSECGVTVSGSTICTIETASPTFAVQPSPQPTAPITFAPISLA